MIFLFKLTDIVTAHLMQNRPSSMDACNTIGVANAKPSSNKFDDTLPKIYTII